MPDTDKRAEPDTQTLADLSALADGTLDPERAETVRQQIAQSPELSRRYDREREAVAALHALRADAAPAALRFGIAARRQPASRRRLVPRRARLIYGGGLATAVAAVVAALVLLLPGGAPGAPSVSQAASLALGGPTMAAPATDPAKLNQDVGLIYFPNWSRLGWRATGQRVDHLGGRVAVTVYYEKASRRIAYTILATPALPWPGTARWWLRGVELQGFNAGSRLVVTWRRAGHTCVLSGSGVSSRLLSSLALSR